MMTEMKVKDRFGNTRIVEISEEDTTYVGAIRAGAPVKMMSGDWRVPLAVVGEGRTREAAVRDTLTRWNDSR